MAAPDQPPLKAIYLSKDGKIFGPYSHADGVKLQTSGEWLLFPYIWDEAKLAWMPNRNPPTGVAAEANVAKLTEGRSAICHNGEKIMTGELHATQGNGCQVIGDMGSTIPTFGVGTKLWVQINDLKTQEATCRGALVASVYRDKSGWLYQLTLQ